ncbi:MAG: HEAT repeat domain-containing protein [Pseudanabaenaceae cyanobacterium bins.68]|nr:HEAT repeat domain-containing protein [Pseudanabaenaceae cyanobacterium bins.68]
MSNLVAPTLPDLEPAVQIAALAAAVDQASSRVELIETVQKLVAQRSLLAVPTLIKVLGYNNPGAAAIAMEGLIDLGTAAVPQILANVDQFNYGARAYSVRALAKIADPRGLELLLSSAVADFAPSVRRAAIKGLGSLRWENYLVDQISRAQTQILTTLRSMLEDEDWSMRYAAVVALDHLASQGRLPYSDQAIAHLQAGLDLEQNGEICIIARIQLALAKYLSN